MGPPSSRGLSAGGQILFGKGLEKGNIQNVLIDGYLWKHKRRLFFLSLLGYLVLFFAGSPSGKLGLWLRLAFSGVSYSTNSLRKRMGQVIFFGYSANSPPA